MAVKEVLKVKESIESIDSKLIYLESEKETLEAEKQALINENPNTVVELDIGTYNKVIHELDDIIGDYDNLNNVYTVLSDLLYEMESKKVVESKLEEKAVELEGK